jgi:Shwachman-Bodian-Diamond syndrome (SBDS) protein
MARGEAEQIKVHFKGQEDDFIILAETASAVQKWRADKTIPLVDVVSSFDVFVTNKHGTQGTLNRASKGVMENEFGTSKEDDVVKKILEDGAVQEQKVCAPPPVLMAQLTLLSQGPARQGERNPTNASGVDMYGH